MAERQWASVWKLYSELRDSTPAQRSSVLAAQPPDIREEVLALLEQATMAAQSSGPMPNLATPEREIPPGTEFGRYVITGLIGAGGFGRVFAAHDRHLRRGVAIKILSARQSARSEDLIEEARSASALNHPNILTIHETIEIDGHPAIVMEFVQGASLRRELTEQSGPLALGKVLGYGRQIAHALAAAHEAGIIHRDVKPENILVRPDGYLKLVDFGLASTQGPGADSSWQPFMGTLSYSSPEQLSAGATLSPASDIFSLGLVLYEMAAGLHPFRRETRTATAEAIASEAASAPSGRTPSIPPELDRLILTTLSKDVGLRPSARQVAESLAALETRSAAAGTASPARAKYWWTAAALLAAAAGVGAFSWRKQADVHPVLASRPLTSRPETESEPAVTADGKWVAFLSTDKPENPLRVYWQAAEGDNPVLLDVPGAFRALAWTPDGKQLTAVRTGAGHPAAIVSIDPRTQAETPLGHTLGTCETMGLDWSPDGRWLAFPDCAPGSRLQAIYVLNPQSGERRKVTSPPATGRGDNRPRFSPDGKRIAFQREASPGVEDVYSVPVPGGDILRITREERTIAGLAWMPDGQSLAVAALRGSGTYSLWRYPATGEGGPRLLTQAGLHAVMPAIGKDSGRLLWVSQNVDINIWSTDVSGAGKPRVLVASTRRDQDPDMSRDGRLAFRSVRTGASEIWVSKRDGSQAFRATNLRGPVTGTPTWSPDGRRLAFDSRPGGNPDIYVIACEGTRCGEPKRLTSDPGADVTPDWSADGKHIYYSSVQTGAKQVWRVDPEGTRHEQVTRHGGLQPRESPDGQWLYYVKGQSTPSLWRMPGPQSPTGLSPDAEEQVLSEADGAVLDSADWIPSNQEIFFAANETGLPRPAVHTIRAYHPGTRRFRRVAAPGTLVFSLSIATDLRQILFCQADRTEANIMVSEGIR